MRARELYESTAVGGTNAASAADWPGGKDAYQAAVAVFEDMEREGLIEIIETRSSKQSGGRELDFVRFARLR